MKQRACPPCTVKGIQFTESGTVGITDMTEEAAKTETKLEASVASGLVSDFRINRKQVAPFPLFPPSLWLSTSLSRSSLILRFPDVPNERN